jgi:hypothetical protein
MLEAVSVLKAVTLRQTYLQPYEDWQQDLVARPQQERMPRDCMPWGGEALPRRSERMETARTVAPLRQTTSESWRYGRCRPGEPLAIEFLSLVRAPKPPPLSHVPPAKGYGRE